MVTFSGPKEKIVALIENKISAMIQPEQGVRYLARARRLGQTGVRPVTVLAAPAGYRGRDGCEHFEVAISYEEMVAIANLSGDSRSIFFRKSLVGASNPIAAGMSRRRMRRSLICGWRVGKRPLG